jgi:hypothetical protein
MAASAWLHRYGRTAAGLPAPRHRDDGGGVESARYLDPDLVMSLAVSD